MTGKKVQIIVKDKVKGIGVLLSYDDKGCEIICNMTHEPRKIKAKEYDIVPVRMIDMEINGQIFEEEYVKDVIYFVKSCGMEDTIIIYPNTKEEYDKLKKDLPKTKIEWKTT